MWEIKIKFKEAKEISDCHPFIKLKIKLWIYYKGLLWSWFKNIPSKLRLSRTPIEPLYWFDDEPCYWLIVLPYGEYACPRCGNYINCINHEVMHGILHEVYGNDAFHSWDNITENVAEWLPDIYGKCQCIK